MQIIRATRTDGLQARRDASPLPAAPSRTRRGRTPVRPEHLGLLVILALSGALELVRLRQNGYANSFYSAAVKSMLRSLHNFFFVSFDPAGLISVDKPPLALWVQTASAKLFGFTPLSLLIPEAICAMIAVALLYRLVTPRFGPLAGLTSALALAVFPSFVAVSRDNGVDPLLILLMLAACAAAVSAAERGRLRTLLASAVFVGLAFNTKSLAALLCVPGIALAYLLCAPLPLRRRIVHLAVAGALFVVVGASWSVAVDLVPASSRPYVGGSTNNTETQLALGYNGFGRVNGQPGGFGVKSKHHSLTPNLAPVHVGTTTAAAPGSASHAVGAAISALAAAPSRSISSKPASSRAKPGVRRLRVIAFGGAESPVRIFGTGFGDQAGWLVPLALAGLIAAAIALRRRHLEGVGSGAERRGRAAILWVLGGWFAVELLTLDFSAGIVHPYYTSALGPGLAAMVGVGAVALAALVRSEVPRVAMGGYLLALFGGIGTVGVQILLIHREGYPNAWMWPMAGLAIIALAAIAPLRTRGGWAVGAAVAVLMVAPALYSTTVWRAPVSGTFPTAGPRNYAGPGGIGSSPRRTTEARDLIAFVRAHGATKRFPLLTQSSDEAAPEILLGLDAAAMGGYNANDSALSADGLANLVARGEARWVLLGGAYANRGGNAASTAARLVCQPTYQHDWLPGVTISVGLILVDCRGRAADLRDATRAGARLKAAERRAASKRARRTASPFGG